MCSINVLNRINNLNLRVDTIKLSEESKGEKKENIGKKLLPIGLVNGFSDRAPKAQATKA